jgi:glycosyltransferase involved in cell wall biosynthesis
MNIALVNCNVRSIPPTKSGGIEKIINHLIDGYIKRGHTVTVFGAGSSQKRPGMKLVAGSPDELESKALPDNEKHRLNNIYTKRMGKKLVEMQSEFDIIHNHCLDSVLSVLPHITKPLVSTVHEAINFDAIDRLQKYKDYNYISVSYAQRRTCPELNYVANIYHGIDLNEYPLPVKADDYMLFVGRISQQKMPHLAILAAKRLKKKLLILGKYKDEQVEHEYYTKTFLPILHENKKLVEWIGECDQQTVTQYMNKAYVTLFPVSFREPFGLAAVEAMASGSPVIAFAHGAYNETIADGISGYLVEDLEEMVAMIKQIDIIERNACREHVQKNFTVDRMIDTYLNTYSKIIKPRISYSVRFGLGGFHLL